MFVVQLTVPVGKLLTAAVSVTVAVHVVDWSMTTVVGLHATAVVVPAGVMLNEALVAPGRPELEAVSV